MSEADREMASFFVGSGYPVFTGFLILAECHGQSPESGRESLEDKPSVADLPLYLVGVVPLRKGKKEYAVPFIFESIFYWESGIDSASAAIAGLAEPRPCL